jgi:hypothetical protein
MIVYQLACEQDHFFEGWFASAEAHARQAEAGQLECPSCGSAEVRKLPAAPHVHTSGGSSAPARTAAPPAEAKLRGDALKAVREFILANTEDVGREFAEIARRIHYKEEEARSIRGQVTGEQAEELAEEGVPAFPISSEIIPSGEIH